MLFNRSKHRSVLPHNLNSHQVLDCSVLIHRQVIEVVTPLLEAKPYYQVFSLLLDKVNEANHQLRQVQTQRGYKSPGEMRGVGGQDGKSGETTLAEVKRRLFIDRRNQMRRYRTMVNWYYDAIPVSLLTDPDAVLTPSQAGGKLLGEMLNQRVKFFERRAYSESTTEFEHLFNAIQSDPEALNAISQLALTEVYDEMLRLHQRFVDVRLDHANVDSSGEAQPKLKPATNDVRLAVRMLLGNMRFDIENGDPTFNPVLGQIDELLDKEHAIAARRETLKKQEKAKAEATKQTSPQGDEKPAESAEEKVAEGTEKSAEVSTRENAEEVAVDAAADTAALPASDAAVTDAGDTSPSPEATEAATG